MTVSSFAASRPDGGRPVEHEARTSRPTHHAGQARRRAGLQPPRFERYMSNINAECPNLFGGELRRAIPLRLPDDDHDVLRDRHAVAARRAQLVCSGSNRRDAAACQGLGRIHFADTGLDAHLRSIAHGVTETRRP